MNKFNYPNELNIIFEKLHKYHIKPIIVGGFVRDSLLKIPSKDIDIELYGINSLKKVEKILSQFGKVNSVGKSFGVCKLIFNDLDLDFSLPRSDSKVHSGHKGFEIDINPFLDFKDASSRRDFTINSIGYDLINKKIVDPHNGISDLKDKILKAVDLNKFGEDPLRVLRAVVFSSRFELKIEEDLFLKLKTMVENNLLRELPQERIYEEIKKLFLKSQKPSAGFILLKEISAFTFFTEFSALDEKEFISIVSSLDKLKKYAHATQEIDLLTLMFSLLTSKFTDEKRVSFINKITNQKEIIKNVCNLSSIKFDLDKQTDYSIYKLATKINIQTYSLYLKSLTNGKQNEIKWMQQKAKELGVLTKMQKPLLRGKDILELGLKPSKEFSILLHDAYEKQIKRELISKTDALNWLKKEITYLKSFPNITSS